MSHDSRKPLPFIKFGKPLELLVKNEKDKALEAKAKLEIELVLAQEQHKACEAMAAAAAEVYGLGRKGVADCLARGDCPGLYQPERGPR